MDALEILRTMRAVRSYSDRPIPQDAVSDILDAARWTGSAKNTQPWELVVVADTQQLAELATLGYYASHLKGATLGVVIVMKEAGQGFDAGRLSQNIMLAAWAHGVGSCIGSIFPAANETRAKELLGIPQERSVHTIIALGYPANTAALRVSSGPENVRSAVPLGRKSLEDLVSWEQYGKRAPSTKED